MRIEKLSINSLDKKQLQDRTMMFVIDIIQLTEKFLKNTAAFVVEKQIICSATSVAANYRAISRTKSETDFIHKLSIVEEEAADETMFWLELCMNLNLTEKNILDKLYQEANEILSIIVASKKQLKANKNETKKTKFYIR